jgi:hypothetical protein
MSNEDIAKELLSVLKDKMMYREGLPSDGWAVEVICKALVAAQQSVQPTGGNCAECCELQVVYDGCCINCGAPATSG